MVRRECPEGLFLYDCVGWKTESRGTLTSNLIDIYVHGTFIMSSWL